jgi:glycosyltransferase involved in cell wall biosynthesis
MIVFGTNYEAKGGTAGGLRPLPLSPLPDTPPVSVLITSYNYARYIGECIESVLRQSYQNFEVIVSDDGSTDGSIQEIGRWAAADPRVRLIAGQHRGMAGALNAAWSQSRGQVICLLDADDTFLTRKVEAVVRAMQSNPQVGYVIHRTCRLDAGGNRRGVLPLLKPGPSGWCASGALAAGGVLADVPPTSNLSFRREVLELIFPLPEDLQGYAELVIQRLAPLLTRVVSLDQALATWRLHGANDINAARISDQQIEREIDVMENLWEIQMRYLEAAAPQAASALQPVARSEYYCRMRYMMARRRSPAEADIWHRYLLDSPGFAGRPLVDRFFWRIAPKLSTRLLNRVLDVTMTQNRAKEWITRLCRIGA